MTQLIIRFSIESVGFSRESIPVHPPGLQIHPLCLHVPPHRGISLPITQLHTKFSRQFKGLLMTFPTVILHCLKSFNIAVPAPSSLHMERCKQACIRLNGRGCSSTFTSLPSTSLPSTSPFTSCPCETSTSPPPPPSPSPSLLL